jgi:hypothetical protein
MDLAVASGSDRFYRQQQTKAKGKVLCIASPLQHIALLLLRTVCHVHPTTFVSDITALTCGVVCSSLISHRETVAHL